MCVCVACYINHTYSYILVLHMQIKAALWSQPKNLLLFWSGAEIYQTLMIVFNEAKTTAAVSASQVHK